MNGRTRKLVLVRTPSGKRVLQPAKRRGQFVEVPRAHRRRVALLPLQSIVEVDCMGTDPIRVIQIQQVKPPASVATTIERWGRGDYGGALAALADDGPIVEQDPHRLAWRVRLGLDLDRPADISRDLRLLLDVPEEIDLGDQPPGLLNLFSALSPELQRELGPALARRVPKLDYQAPEVRRLLDMLPLDLWPDRYLCHRLKTGAMIDEIERWLREAKQREARADEAARPKLEQAISAGTARLSDLRGRPEARAVVHPILRKALSVAPPGARPTLPFHAGGPPPVLIGARRAALVTWMVGETKARTGKKPGTRTGPQDPRLVAGHAVELIGAREPESAVRAFLLELDQAMMRIELEGWLERHRDVSAARALSERIGAHASVVRVLFRGADASGRVRAWLVGLDGSRGLLCEVKGTWIWTEGTFDEVIASVPDQWFEGAATALTDRP